MNLLLGDSSESDTHCFDCCFPDEPDLTGCHIDFLFLLVLKENLWGQLLASFIVAGCHFHHPINSVIVESLVIISLFLTTWYWHWRDGIKGSNAPSLKSPVVDEERMRPRHWLGSVLYVFLQCFDSIGWVMRRTSS